MRIDLWLADLSDYPNPNPLSKRVEGLGFTFNLRRLRPPPRSSGIFGTNSKSHAAVLGGHDTCVGPNPEP